MYSSLITWHVFLTSDFLLQNLHTSMRRTTCHTFKHNHSRFIERCRDCVLSPLSHVLANTEHVHTSSWHGMILEPSVCPLGGSKFKMHSPLLLNAKLCSSTVLTASPASDGSLESEPNLQPKLLVIKRKVMSLKILKSSEELRGTIGSGNKRLWLQHHQLHLSNYVHSFNLLLM